MLATINGQPQRFRMTMQNGPSITLNCQDFLATRDEENRLLDGIDLPENGDVLDWGCGVGRHLSYVRQTHPSVHCCGIDVCDLMLDHCRRSIVAPATFAHTLEELPHREFDLILLMGNGLGVLGDEQGAVERLQQLVRSLRLGGRIVIETGNPFGRGYSAPAFTIEYGGHHDGPFTWGCSDRDWLSQTLEQLGCAVALSQSQAPGGMFFFAVAERGEQGAAPDGNSATLHCRR